MYGSLKASGKHFSCMFFVSGVMVFFAITTKDYLAMYLISSNKPQQQ